MSNSWNRRHRWSEEQKRMYGVRDRFHGALRRKDFAKAIEINRHELGLPDYVLDSYLTRYGWKPAPTREERRVSIAQQYGVPVKWVMLEEELAKRRTHKRGFVGRLREGLLASLQSFVLHLRHSAITGG